MGASNRTEHYNLPQFISTDKPAWLTDINTAFKSIDTALNTINEKAGGDSGEIETLKERVNQVDQKIDNTKTEIEENLKLTNQNVTNLQSKAATTDQTIETIQSSIQTANSRIDKIDSSTTQTLSHDSWLNETSYYTYDLTLSGITEDSAPVIGLALQPGDYASAEAKEEDFAKIFSAITNENKIKFYAKSAITNDLKISIVRY